MGLLQVPEWLPYGETQHVTGDNDPIYGVNGTINRCPKTLWSHIQILAAGIDTLIVQWVDATHVKVSSGGVCWADDGVQGYQLTADVTVTLSSLSASSAYFLWIGEESGAISVKRGNAHDAMTVPSGLIHAHRIPGWFVTDGSSNVIRFADSLFPRTPRGEIIEWPAAYAPYGMVFCNGVEKSRTNVPWKWGYDLFGTTHGTGDGSTTYNLPDKAGRCGIGAGTGSGLTARTLGSKMGEEGHSNIGNENGPHTHIQRIKSYNSDGAVGVRGSGYANNDDGGATGSSGLGTAHNTMQPSVVMNYVMAL